MKYIRLIICNSVAISLLFGTSFTRSEETPTNHFDREYPQNLTVEVNYRFFKISWSPPENQTDLNNYAVYHARDLNDTAGCPNDDMKPLVVNATEHTYTLKVDQAGSSYIMCLVANYSTGHQPHSMTFHRTTLGCGPKGANKTCEGCNMGAAHPENHCDERDCTCRCNSKYFKENGTCDSCVDGYYFFEVMNKCEPCPCKNERALGTCGLHGDNGKVLMCDCLPKYQGNRCQYCAPGLYKIKEGPKCGKCECNGNTNPDDMEMCDHTTGRCHCYYNTTGDQCDVCLEGFTGNALKRQCEPVPVSTPAAPIAEQHTEGFYRLHLATIAGIVVASVGLVIMVVTILAVVRWKRLRQRPFNLWTVELRNDHENVNFSQMMEEHDQPADGVQYFEKDRQPTGPRASRGNGYRAVRT